MVVVRRARPADVGSIAAVHAASVRGLAADSYDDRQIASWSDSEAADFSIPPEGVHVVVAESHCAGDPARADDPDAPDGGVVGFGAVDLQSGEVRAVYVHPDHAGEGVGSAILRELEGRARDEGLADLHLTASLTAVPFYERHGWESTEPTAYELEEGVELEAVEMEKSL
jgi:putative acetyltransferase